MKKLWSVILLIGLVNAQMPEPTMVGQDKLQFPTLTINNFVNQAEIEGLEDSRVFLGITNILTENVMDSRYDLVENESDFILEDQEHQQQYLGYLKSKPLQQKLELWLNC